MLASGIKHNSSQHAPIATLCTCSLSRCGWRSDHITITAQLHISKQQAEIIRAWLDLFWLLGRLDAFSRTINCMFNSVVENIDKSFGWMREALLNHRRLLELRKAELGWSSQNHYIIGAPTNITILKYSPWPMTNGSSSACVIKQWHVLASLRFCC